MDLHRRQFIGLGSLAACGAVLKSGSLFAASSPAQTTLFDENDPVLAYVAQYSPSSRVVGASVLGSIRGTPRHSLHVLAEVRTNDDLLTALRRVPFKGVYAQGDSLSFLGDTGGVTIENLFPDTFESRLKAMAKPAGNAFAHDALAYDLQTKTVSDPFDARVGVLKLVNKNFIGPTALDVTLRGLIEAAQLGMKEDQEFTRWKSNVLGWTATRVTAPKYAQSFLRPLAVLANELPAGTVETLVHSHLISAALKLTLGMDGATAVAAYQKVRSEADPATPAGAVWLAALKAPGRNGGDVTRYLQGGTSIQMLRSQEALAQAQAL